MGIYISDLEIPKDKAVQIVIIRDDGVCVDEWGNTYGVVSLPSHGRLVDADALYEEMFKIYLDIKEHDGISAAMFYACAMHDVKDAPTIIDEEPCNDLSKPNNDADYPPSIPLKQVWTELFGEEGE